MTSYLFVLLRQQVVSLWLAALKFLALPLAFADALVTDIQLEWYKYEGLLSAGTPPSLEQMFPLFKWICLLVAVVALALLLVYVTVKGVVFDGIKQKTAGAVFGDTLILLLIFFLYYFVAASVIYFIFHILGVPL